MEIQIRQRESSIVDRDFLEKVIRLSAEVLQKEDQPDIAQKFDEILELTHDETSDLKAINRLRAFLLDWKEKSRRKILVLLENADRNQKIIGRTKIGDGFLLAVSDDGELYPEVWDENGQLIAISRQIAQFRKIDQ